jgi:tetratricopeptide (TPR) repeat protein
MRSDASGDQLESIVTHSTHELSARASLVARGLRDIAERLRSESVGSAQEQSLELLNQGRIEEAIATCSSGLEISPTDEILWQIKGVCLAKQGQYGEGLNCIDRALQSNAENPYCWVLKCKLLRDLNRTEERLECWRRVIEIAPDFKGASKEIGDSLFDLKRFGEAAQAYDSELTLNPLDAECRSKKDIALKRLARSQQGVAEHVQAADWNRPTIILTIGHWWTEPYSPPYAHMKFFNCVCHIQNISDRTQRLGKETTVFHRSKATGEMSPMADAVLLEITLPLQLAPQSACDQVVLELLWPFPKEKSDDDCVREILDDSYETLAYDDAFGTVIMFSRV